MKLAVTVVGAACAVLATAAPAAAVTHHPPTYANCTAMHAKYPHGVGRKGAHDATSGRPVTTFYRNTALYNANTKSDRDHDGVACEAH